MSTAPSRPDLRISRRSGRRRLPVAAIGFLAPAVVLFAAFLVYPMINTVWLSFTEWNGFLTTRPEFVGLENYERIFTKDPVFWRAVGNTAIWLVLSMVVPIVIGLVLALAVNNKLFGRDVMRSVFYLPAVVASIAVASIWVWLYNPTSGLINQVLDAVGLGAVAPDWLGDPRIALYSVFVAFVWQTVGANMVLFLAGLQGVPAELIEAARVDGASRLQSFLAVTLPALRPTTVVVFVLTMINSLKVFDLIVGMTGGGPAQSTQVLALWSFTQSFRNNAFGVGSAVATVLFVVSLLLVVPYMVWTLRKDAR